MKTSIRSVEEPELYWNFITLVKIKGAIIDGTPVNIVASSYYKTISKSIAHIREKSLEPYD